MNGWLIDGEDDDDDEEEEEQKKITAGDQSFSLHKNMAKKEHQKHSFRHTNIDDEEFCLFMIHLGLINTIN